MPAEGGSGCKLHQNRATTTGTSSISTSSSQEKICWKRYSPRTRTMLYIAVQDFLSARDFPINASASTIQFYRVLRDGHSPYTIFLCFLRRNCCGQYKMERSSNALERRTSTDRDRMRMAMTMVMTSAGHRAIARW